jgi:hypothetical protein
MLPILAFSSTGFLIGIMTAFSSDHLSRIVVPLIFALFGGSLMAFGQKVSPEQRTVAYASLLSITGACAFGIIIGVLCVEHKWLSPGAEAQLGVTGSKIPAQSRLAVGGDSANQGYLHAQTLSPIDSIQFEVNQGRISKVIAYDQLIEKLRELPPECASER